MDDIKSDNVQLLKTNRQTEMFRYVIARHTYDSTK